MSPDRALSMLCNVKGVDFRAMARATGEHWTSEDAAIACSFYVNRYGTVVRLDPRAEAAARYRWSRDSSVVHALKGTLLFEAEELRYREGWATRIKRLQGDRWLEERYLEDLVDLAILEEHHWFMLRQYELWAVYMRVQPFFWARKLSKHYEAIRSIVESWCGDAHSHVARKLRHVQDESHA